MDAKGDFEKLLELNIVGVRYGLLLSMPICIFLVFFGESMLKLWLGSSGLTGEDLHLMALMLAAIAIPFSLSAPQVASRSILAATGRHWPVAYGFFISALVGLLVSIILMKWSKLGVLGAAIGLSSTYLFTGVALYPMLICRHLDIPLKIYFKKVYISPLIVGILLATCCFSMNLMVENTDTVMIIVKISVFLIVALLLTLYIGLYPQHRKDLFRGLKQNLWAT
jgi:Na+-driven multidrug efflux pump